MKITTQVVIDLKDLLANHYTRCSNNLLSLAEGPNFGTPNENQTKYGLQVKMANYHTP